MSKITKVLMLLITNPVFILTYLIFAKYLDNMFKYGRDYGAQYVIILSVAIFLIMLIFNIISVTRDNKSQINRLKSRSWICLSTTTVIIITLIIGLNTYKALKGFDSAISRLVRSIRTETYVTFEKDNIYEYGIKGLFDDINEKYRLPQNLYIDENIKIYFNKDGKILNFNTYVYEENNKAYLINYESDKSNKILIHEQENINPKNGYDYDKLVQPCIETISKIPFENIINEYENDVCTILYEGKIKHNSGEEIYLINEKTKQINKSKCEVEGYTVCVYIPGEEVPYKYNLINDSSWNVGGEIHSKDKEQDKLEQNIDKSFYSYLIEDKELPPTMSILNDGIAYKLTSIDGALGKSFYILEKTIDGGMSWSVINENPFDDYISEPIGIKFISESIGFISIPKENSTKSILYRSINEGKSFEAITIETLSIELDNGELITTYDTIGVPYIKDGLLYLEIGQGVDGDYKSGNSMLYSSIDEGQSWKFEKEID